MIMSIKRGHLYDALFMVLSIPPNIVNPTVNDQEIQVKK
jgi:hypothetical protein